MSLKSLIEKLEQLNSETVSEAVKDIPGGRRHTAEPGGYGRKDDEDEQGKKVQATVKRGRGRPSTTGAHSQSPEEKEKQAKREKAGKDLQSFMVGNLPGGKAPGKKGQVHKIKDESIEESTDVTDYTPKSKGGTRAELIAKYKKTKDPKDAEAARKAGATQKELQAVTEMDKSQSSSDRGGESSGNPYAKGGKATPVKSKTAAKDAEKILNKSMKKTHPNTWHDVDPRLGKMVDKMSQAEKVKKGWAHPDTLKKQGVAEGSDHDDDYSTASFEKWKKQKEYEKEYDKKKPAKPVVPNNKDKKKGVAEGGIIKSIKRGLQGWDKNAVGPGGEKLGDPRDIVRRAKAMDTDTAKKVRSGLDGASDHSPAGLQKRVLDRKLKGVAEGEGVYRHKGTYGTSYDSDDTEKAAPAVKRGRGRPRKDADVTGHVPKWDTETLSKWIVGSKPKTLPGKPGVKHKLKDWMEHVETRMIVESIVDESRMSEVDIVFQDLVNGNLDIYDVMNHPRDEEQQYASKILHKKYERIAGEEGLHPDDDFEKIQARILDELEHEYHRDLDEVALDPSQVAAPQIKAPGATATTVSTMQKPTTTPTTTGGQAQLGAAIIDFKNPQDPLKAALQQAVKNKQVAVMATESKQITESAMGEKLDGILRSYPHEHKLAQEGWGMHESLYQALCDHYWHEGRIPRETMHGDRQALRDFVEECYMQDTQQLAENPLVGLAVRGLAAGAGAELAKHALDDDVDPAKIPAFRRKALGHEPLSTAQVGTTDMWRVGNKTFTAQQTDFARKFAEVSGLPLEKLGESEMQAELDSNIEEMEQNMSESKLDEKYMGFEKVKAAAAKGGAKDPGAVAAAIGREKYGKEKFQKAAAAGKKLGEAEGQVNEKLTKSMSAGDIISDFVGSDDPKFKGKSKAERTKMALGAYYGMHPEKSRKKTEEADMQMESWDQQLNALLNEGMTVTTSTGNAGAADSVSVSATDEDAQSLMKILQHSGVLHSKSTAMSAPADDEAGAVTVEPVSADEVMGTLEPQGDDHGDEAMGFLKRMIGARQSDQASSDYEQEAGAETDQEPCETCGHAECECDHEEQVDEMDNYEQTQHSSSDHTMSPLSKAGTNEELKGGQKKLDKAPPFGKLTGADFAALRKDKTNEEDLEEEALDQPATMESDDWAGAGAQDMAAAIAQNATSREAAETEKETAMSESEETCNECGAVMEEDHKCNEELNEWANSPNGKSTDEAFLADMAFMTKLISGGLNNMKQDQTTVPSARVKTNTEVRSTENSMAEMLRKLQNIN